MNKAIIENTKLEGLKIITPPTIFEDYRGLYIETYNKNIYESIGVKHKFIADDFIISDKYVIRNSWR